VWEEVRRELSLDGVRPVSPDEEALSAICSTTEDTASRTVAEQNSILKQQQEEDAKEDQLLYTEIKSHWKQQELTAKSWELYVAKTSNYNILKEVKEQREKHMESSREKSKDKGAAFHPPEVTHTAEVSLSHTHTHTHTH
ncbi:cilia- and flagella-associated protein 69-like, partial [Thalassophryne amazonica]|uniref:cilia- and flagella-associated protein 69-like n=1 Tax=Thalassophryne amazonica TaxID=390379 RepID=UPI00147150F5